MTPARSPLEHTDLSVSPVLYGCMKIAGDWKADPLAPSEIERALSCIRAATEGGVNFFDHADIYAQGRAEQAFSFAWTELGLRRDDIVLQSKCGIRRPGEPNADSPHRFDLSAEHIMRSVENILRRLKTDHLDILLLHRPDPLIDPDDVARAFERLRSQKLVRYFGVSNHNAAQVALLQRSLDTPLAANQLEFNLLQSDLVDEGVSVNNADQRHSFRADGTLEYCRLHGVSMQAYSPVAKGKISSPPADADERLRTTSRVVREVSESRGVSMDAIQIAWILRHPARIQPVLGTTRPERIREALRGTEVDLTRDEWYRLFTAGRGRPLP